MDAGGGVRPRGQRARPGLLYEEVFTGILADVKADVDRGVQYALASRLGLAQGDSASTREGSGVDACAAVKWSPRRLLIPRAVLLA